MSRQQGSGRSAVEQGSETAFFCVELARSKLHDLLKSPKLRGTLATIAGSTGYAVLGTAGYKSGVDTTAGIDAEQLRTLFSVAFAVVGFVLPAGISGVIRNWANVLGKESADRLTALEARVVALEKPAQKPAAEVAK